MTKREPFRALDNLLNPKRKLSLTKAAEHFNSMKSKIPSTSRVLTNIKLSDAAHKNVRLGTVPYLPIKRSK